MLETDLSIPPVRAWGVTSIIFPCRRLAALLYRTQEEKIFWTFTAIFFNNRLLSCVGTPDTQAALSVETALAH